MSPVDSGKRHRLWHAVVASGLAMPLSACGTRTEVFVDDADASETTYDVPEEDTAPPFTIDTSPLPDLGPPDDVEDTSHPHIK